MKKQARIDVEPVAPIRVTSEKEFERLRDRIDREVSHARHHWDLLKSIEEASGEYWREMKESIKKSGVKRSQCGTAGTIF